MSAVVSLGAGKLLYMEKLNPENGDWQQWQVCYCGICKTDRSLAWSDKTEGLVLGHEVVCRDKYGHYFALNNEISCGECDYCREDMTSHCRRMHELGVTHHGGFATCLSAPEQSLYPLHLEDPRLGIFVEPLACAMHGVDRLRKALALENTDEPRILVIGAGVAGKMIVHLLLHQTSAHLTLCDVNPDTLQWAADWSLDSVQTPFCEHYHAVVECSGGKGALDTALASIRRAGVLLIYGIPAVGEALPISAQEVFSRELTIMASMAGCTQSTFLRSLSYIEQHQGFFASMMGKKVYLQQLPYELLYNPPQPGTRSWVFTDAR